MTSLPVTSSPMVRRETPCSCDAVVVGCPDASKAMTLYACIRILLVCIIVKVSAGKLIQPGRLNQGSGQESRLQCNGAAQTAEIGPTLETLRQQLKRTSLEVDLWVEDGMNARLPISRDELNRTREQVVVGQSQCGRAVRLHGLHSSARDASPSCREYVE